MYIKKQYDVLVSEKINNNFNELCWITDINAIILIINLLFNSLSQMNNTSNLGKRITYPECNKGTLHTGEHQNLMVFKPDHKSIILAC